MHALSLEIHTDYEYDYDYDNTTSTSTTSTTTTSNITTSNQDKFSRSAKAGLISFFSLVLIIIILGLLYYFVYQQRRPPASTTYEPFANLRLSTLSRSVSDTGPEEFQMQSSPTVGPGLTNLEDMLRENQESNNKSMPNFSNYNSSK